MTDNLRTYAGEAGRLWVIDNSEQTLPPDLERFLAREPVVEYVRFGENRGIARALNEGAARAREAGFRWLLTMDQDSRATPGMVRRLWSFAVSGTVPRVAIVAARPDTPRRTKAPGEEWSIMPCVIASGNLVDLAAWADVGGFEDHLFIDCVDTVFSLALRRAGWAIVQLNRVVLNHRLGRSELRRFLGVKMTPTHHNPLRRYYIARNRLYMHRKFGRAFPGFMRTDRAGFAKEIIKLLLFEDLKWLKLRMTLRGLRDCRRGKMGKYEEP